MEATPAEPFGREYLEINAGLRKLLKKFKQLELEGIETEDFPAETQKLLSELLISTGGGVAFTDRPGPASSYKDLSPHRAPSAARGA